MPLLAHLRVYGEATPNEVSFLRAREWLPILIAAGWAKADEKGLLLATPALLSLPPTMDETNLLRTVCFSYPTYRRRLLGVLAYGMVDAGQKKLYDRLAQWAVHDLPHLTPPLNALLDELEAAFGQPMVMSPSQQVYARFEAFYANLGDFREWDQALLGLSVAPPDLFAVVLEKFGKASLPQRTSDLPTKQSIALLPNFPLQNRFTGRLVPLQSEPWTTARSLVHSSLPLFDVAGQPLFDSSKQEEIIWQDALAEQPYYRAVIHLAYAHRLGLGEADQLALRCADDLNTILIEIGQQPVGSLADLLAELVGVMGYYSILPSTRVDIRLTNLLHNLLAVHILTWHSARHLLSLAEDYALSLGVLPRARTLARGKGRKEREAMLKYLQAK